MNISITKFAATLQTPVFPKTIHQLRTNSNEATSNPELQSTREKRGLRQMQTTHSSQTFFRICGNFSL